MQVYAVFGVSNPQLMTTILSEKFPNNYFLAQPDAFFVAATGVTTRQLGDKLGFDGSQDLAGIVIPVTSYWGRHSTELWEWINLKMNSDG